MPPLTKVESCYFIVFALVCLGILIGTLVAVQNMTENCWTKYQTEQAAIEHCEQP